MGNKIYNYKDIALKKNGNLFNAEVIKFPNEKKKITSKDVKKDNYNFWKITDVTNKDQLKAVTVVCIMFVALIIMGLYSNLV